MAGRPQTRKLAWLGAFISLVLAGTPAAAQEGAAQEMVRDLQNVGGDSKPIVLSADEISTWTDKGRRIIVLKGKVLVEHGLSTVRAQQAVAWIDDSRYRQARIIRVDLYAEGEVQLENGTATRSAPKVLLDWSTRGDVKIKSHGSKVRQESLASDPFYQRARDERSPPPAVKTPPAAANTTPATANTPPSTANTTPATTNTTPTNLQQTSFEQPAATAGNSEIVPVQAPAPGVGPAPGSGPLPVPGVGSAPGSGPLPAPNPPTLQPPLPVRPAPGLPDAGGVMQPQIPTSPGQPAGPPPQPPPRSVDPPAAALPPAASGPPRVITIAPRTSAPFNTQRFTLPNGEKALVIVGGIMMTVRNFQGAGIMDVEADRLIFWTKGDADDLFKKMKGKGHATKEMEFYLSGNVEVRQHGDSEDHTLRAAEVYYDLGRNVAVAVSADMAFTQPKMKDAIHMKADELLQLSPTVFEGLRSYVYSSKLPSDPGIRLYVRDALIENKRAIKKTIYGQEVLDPKTGMPISENQMLFTGRNTLLEIEDVPVFWFPYLHVNPRDPLGPMKNFNFGFSNLYGYQLSTTWNGYELFGMDPRPGTSWQMEADYLSARGPALGTNYNYYGKEFFGLPSNYIGSIRAYGIRDTGADNLGGGRGPNDDHPIYRGRVLWQQNITDLPLGFTVQSQFAPQSDHNFLEQYYKMEWDTGIDESTFIYTKQQQGVWAWTSLVEPRIRNWVTETEWLPRVDGSLIGQSFFDLFTYNAHASVGYAHLLPASSNAQSPQYGTPQPPPFTNVNDSTGRADYLQEVSMPFYAGPVKLAPYAILDLTDYTADIAGNNLARAYGAVGFRGSLPLSRLYPDFESDLFNVNGINHKIVLGANFFTARSSTPFYNLPQLDQLNDNATNQALFDINPLQPTFNLQNGLALQNSPLFNPQLYALRQMGITDNNVDTLNTMEQLRMDVRQRWQTKRGYPGMQHIVDWMTLDTSAIFFPQPTRDDLGQAWNLLQYDYNWNLGDRTTLVSSGLYDPHYQGPHIFTLGGYLNRPDRTNFYLGYRQIDPLNSKAVTASVTYIFSPKYAVNGSSTYDFGIGESVANSISLTRMGADVQVSLGVTYNAMQNNFGLIFQVIPNLLPTASRLGGMGMGAGGMSGPGGFR